MYPEDKCPRCGYFPDIDGYCDICNDYTIIDDMEDIREGYDYMDPLVREDWEEDF